jgi:hypothetical protein
MFLRTLHGLLTALDLSAPCYSLCADVLNIWSAFSQSIHSSFCVIACHMYWSRHLQVTGFSSCFDASVGLLKKEVLSSEEWLHTEDEVMGCETNMSAASRHCNFHEAADFFTIMTSQCVYLSTFMPLTICCS